MIKEILNNSIRAFIPGKPSNDLEIFVEAARNGENPAIPTFGKGLHGVFDYYGMDNTGTEKSRFRIPWGKGDLEMSFHILKKGGGEILVTQEGIYPSSI